MPELKRDFFGAYYSADTSRPNNFYGTEVYHAVQCGTFMADGVKRALMFYTLCKDDLQDTQGKNCEMCDFALLFADFDQMPSFVKGAMANTPIDTLLQALAPYARSLVQQDLQEGCDIWTIIERRAAVLCDLYLGMTLSEVLEFKPEIWQPTTDEAGNEIPNVVRCSLELNY